jgi:hypothetical protein
VISRFLKQFVIQMKGRKMEDKGLFMFVTVAVVCFCSLMGFLGYCGHQSKMELIRKYPEVLGHTQKEAGKIIARIEKEKREKEDTIAEIRAKIRAEFADKTAKEIINKKAD